MDRLTAVQRVLAESQTLGFSATPRFFEPETGPVGSGRGSNLSLPGLSSMVINLLQGIRQNSRFPTCLHEELDNTTCFKKLQ